MYPVLPDPDPPIVVAGTIIFWKPTGKHYIACVAAKMASNIPKSGGWEPNSWKHGCDLHQASNTGYLCQPGAVDTYWTPETYVKNGWLNWLCWVEHSPDTSKKTDSRYPKLCPKGCGMGIYVGMNEVEHEGGRCPK